MSTPSCVYNVTGSLEHEHTHAHTQWITYIAEVPSSNAIYLGVVVLSQRGHHMNKVERQQVEKEHDASGVKIGWI